jgi:hypothetical protein
MDDAGPETSRSSPFQQRRAMQIALLQEAWPTVFPQDRYALTSSNAKSFLGWCENSAALVYEEIGDIARRKPDLEAPVSYVRAVLKRKCEEGRLVVRPESARQRQVTSATSEVGRGWDGELVEPSAEWREKQRRVAEYANSIGWSE